MSNRIVASGDRLAWLDVAKGIGIALVVYGHVARGLANAGLFSGAAFEWVDDFIYSFHMPLFFFLSGYFLDSALLGRSGTELLVKKVDVLIYPYLLWGLGQGAIEASFSPFTNGGITWAEAFAVVWSPRAQFWFLYALFLIFCSAVLLKRLWRYSPLCVLSIFLVAYLMLPWLSVWFLPRTLAAFGVFFFAGAWLGRCNPEFKNACRWEVSCVFLFLSCLSILQPDALLKFLPKYIFEGVLAALGVWTVCSWSLAFVHKVSVLEWLGRHSMFIFLSHVIFGSGVRVFLQKFLGVESVVIHLVLGNLVGLFLCAWLSHWLVERRGWNFLISFTGFKRLFRKPLWP